MLHDNRTDAQAPERPSVQIEAADQSPLRLLESCHSMWIFDPDRMRFRRVPRGTRLDMPSPESDWTAYFRLEVEPASGAFAVDLTEDGTRVLRSWLHTDACRHCASDQTGEMSLDDLRRGIA